MKEERARHIAKTFNNTCPICGDRFLGNNYEIHHGGVHNKKINRKQYPYSIDRMPLVFPLCRKCHEKSVGYGRFEEGTVEEIEMFYTLFAKLLDNESVNINGLIKELQYWHNENKYGR